jgi:hypothetical protein
LEGFIKGKEWGVTIEHKASFRQVPARFAKKPAMEGLTCEEMTKVLAESAMKELTQGFNFLV